MSGPKGAGYEVVSAAELERRALRRAEARMADLVARARAFAADVDETRSIYGAGIAAFSVPAAAAARFADSRSCEAAADALEAALASAEPAFRASVSAARTAAILAATSPARSVGKRDSRPSAGQVQPQPSAGQTQAQPHAEPTAGVAERVTRVLARLAAPPGRERDAVEALAAAVVAEAQPARADLLLRSLQDQVQAANVREGEAEGRRAAVRGLRAQLLGRPGETVQALLGTLDRLGSGAEPFDLRELSAQVSAAVQASEREQDRQFAVRTAVECLEQLGYEVSEGFDTVVAQGGVTYLRRATWPGYAVQVRSGARPELGFNVVRDAGAAGAASAVRDAEIESSWCEDFSRLRSAAERAGVRLSLSRSAPPGAVPVQVVPSAVLGRAARRASVHPARQAAREHPPS